MFASAVNRFKPGLFLFVLLATLVMSPVAFGQATTGALAGSVASADDGSFLPGVTIEALHVPTGTRYSSVTGANGRFMIPNVKVGGPYKVSATLEGFQTAETGGVDVRLGATAEVATLKMKVGGVAESIVVTAEADPIINPNRSGSTSAVSTETIESLPTVNRSIQDFARTNPYFVVDAQDFSSTRFSVAGRNNRYNTIQIDGAVNNDLFGLADTGTPGGQTDSQPISLDAVGQIQMVVSPYDVRQGGFTGGGVNVVTRSGTNDLQGSVFYSERNESLVGDGPFDKPIANFDQTLYGGRLGGRIIKDKLFFFVSGEVNDKEAPTGVSADGSTGTVYSGTGTGSLPSAELFRNYLIDKYGYDPGSLGDFGAKTTSDLALIKFDWTINSSNTATFRHNYIDAGRDVVADRSSTRYRFESAIYNQADTTNSSVIQVNSVFNANTFNEARVGLQTIRDERATPVTFPTIEIGGTGARNGALHAGTERFSGANSLDQDILELTDDLTLLNGNHTITIGTHNEFFTFKNLFLSEFYGYWYFPTLDAFYTGKPTEYRISYANGDDPRKATSFDVRQFGLYAGDQWRMNNNFTFTYGLRIDKPDYVDNPSYNPVVMSALGYDTSRTASNNMIFSPRLGFNWDPTGDAKQQIRGGLGIFAGRTPYVWLSNTYGNTGVESTALSCTGSCASGLTFTPDPNNQPKSGAAGSTISVDLVDPEFQMPHVMRATLGYDRELPWDIRGTVEVLYSETQRDVYYLNVNRELLGKSPLDGRPTYRKRAGNIADAIMMTNTSKGDELAASLVLNKRFGQNFNASFTYAYQDSNSAFDGTSSRAISNWQFHHTKGDIFHEELSRSAFEIEDRFNVALTYDLRTGPLTHSFGLFYNAQSGRPYSLLIGGDPNTDGYSTNDLLFVPAGGVILENPTGGRYTDDSRFVAFLQSAGVDPHSGRILDRYELTEPWTQQIDVSYQLGIPELAGVGTQLTFDIVNVGNLIDKEYGNVEYVSNQNYIPVNYRGIDATTGKPIYREAANNALNPGRQFQTADVRSRWQARLGVRFTF
jgi:hypothetical protein